MDIAYAPQPDGQTDPGEIIWARVPYEEDAALEEATFNHRADEARRQRV